MPGPKGVPPPQFASYYEKMRAGELAPRTNRIKGVSGLIRSMTGENAEEVIGYLVDLVTGKEKAPHRDRLHAASELLNRGWGKPVDVAVHLTTAAREVSNVPDMSDETLEQVLRQLGGQRQGSNKGSDALLESANPTSFLPSSLTVEVTANHPLCESDGVSARDQVVDASPVPGVGTVGGNRVSPEEFSRAGDPKSINPRQTLDDIDLHPPTSENIKTPTEPRVDLPKDYRDLLPAMPSIESLNFNDPFWPPPEKHRKKRPPPKFPKCKNCPRKEGVYKCALDCDCDCGHGAKPKKPIQD